ncbi:hypothetical protein HYW84_01645 [Candidatus Peregrinibacteria bacterium]|nr:hypothetical protein [Candidatus Peregrinibacteria bacterium]
MLTFTSVSPTSFRLQNGDATLTVFPNPSDAAKSGKSGITLAAVPEEEGSQGVISWPGEYNISGVSIRGIGHDDGRQVSYVADPDHIRCAFLSEPVKDWTDRQIEAVGDVSVLVLPAADAKLTQKLVDEFDPRVLILLPGKDKDALKSVEKIIGVKERVGEYKIKGSLPAEGREVVVLQ